ncbi:hypothetical protein PENSOL_c084G08159 [Penicillium solitum]|uniref:Uncharacterized protein n=1 Tax=Penicillium solitum TaxID=60172 RepID=A0A1V6QCC2_9EURO|nr:uncharacterized protein PENSOL_c084G08159 [Penicillium solitum]OQD86855.1 hypothetical protein PENSOL_c084G08159 [Penicillium solitum]
MAGVQGSYNPIFKFVRDLLKHNLAEGKEVGASISANTDGQNVVDIWVIVHDGKYRRAICRATFAAGEVIPNSQIPKLYREGSTFLETNNYTCLTITSTALQNEGQVNGATAIA